MKSFCEVELVGDARYGCGEGNVNGGIDAAENFDSPVAGWCRIFRNIANFAAMRDDKEGHFREVVKEMKVGGLSEKEMIEYFSDMYTLEDIQPYIDGGHELGYRKGREDGRAEGLVKGIEKGMEKGREEERLSIVLKMKSINIPVETIAEVTGLSVEEIEKED